MATEPDKTQDAQSNLNNIVLNRLNKQDETIKALTAKVEQLEKVVVRVIDQVEKHKHLPDGSAAMPLGL